MRIAPWDVIVVVVCLFAGLGAAQQETTPTPDIYIDKAALSYLGYIFLGVFLIGVTTLLVYLCYFNGTLYPAAFLDNLKLQVPRPSRLMKTDLSEVIVETSEYDMTAAVFGTDIPLISQTYLAWRRSQLNTSVLLYLIVLVIDIVTLNNEDAFGVAAEKSNVSDDSYQMRERAKEQLLQFLPFVQTIIAIVFYSASAWRWSSYTRSIRLVSFGWFLVFFLPFIYFFVPWMDIVSPKEKVQGLCMYSLKVINKVYAVIGVELQLDGKTVDVKEVCSEHIEDMTSTVTGSLQLIDTASGDTSLSQFVLTFVGLLLRYIIYLPFLVGAVEALKSLAPGVLGLMLGLQGGLKMSKLMFPGVRVTSWMLIILQASALPIVMCVMALLLVVVGTVPVMVTAVLITASMGLFLVYSEQLLRAVTREEAYLLMTRIARVAAVLQVLGLGFLVMGIYMADHLIALKAQGVAVVKNLLTPLYVARLITKTLAGMFVSKVVFVDVVLHIIISTYIGVYDDASETRRDLFEELTHFACLFPKYETYKAVIPDNGDGDIELKVIPDMKVISVSNTGQTMELRDGTSSPVCDPHYLSIGHGLPFYTRMSYAPAGQRDMHGSQRSRCPLTVV